MAQFVSRLPDPRLRPYVKVYFWGYDSHAPRVQRIVPNGEMGLCFYRSNPVIYDGVGRVNSCLAGQNIHYQDIISIDGKIEIVGAEFTTLGACLFFQTPLQEYFGKTVHLSDLQDLELANLEDGIMNAPGACECFALMDRFFLNRLADSKADAMNLRRLQRALAYGMSHTADAGIDDFAQEACLSPRHFSRLFSSMAGLTPKDYLRLQRYRTALHELKKPGSKLTSVALDCGYYDHSHMIHEFKAISGYSPAQLIGLSENDADEFGWRL